MAVKRRKETPPQGQTIQINYKPNPKQRSFHASSASEVVYGGAKGGGKSCALVMEALAYALENRGAAVYLFRETYDDLEANLVLEWKEKVPAALYTYSETKHLAKVAGGSVVYFRYITSEEDAQRYQGRSMDFIGVDELTRHTERTIQILLSCLRSPKGYRPTFKATCNPGGIGHSWVKERYILPTGYGKHTATDPVSSNTICFVPATVYDNEVLMQNDPAYVRRLENLPPAEKKAFLYGDWDIFKGQYFGEFKRSIHVVAPFSIPTDWRRYLTIDYGLDMLAALWIALDWQGKAYVYREVYQKGLIISEAAQAIKAAEGGESHLISMRFAPPDLFNRRQETGKSAIELFAEQGLCFVRSNNSRVQGWYELKEWLKPTTDEQGIPTARLTIFENCENLIRTLPQLQYDKCNPNDVATEPHELTHAPDALRGFVAGRPLAPIPEVQEQGSPRSFLDYGV